MEQDSAKKGSAGATGTWRDKLGIRKELPKISSEFAGSPRNVAAERREPSLAAAPVRPGASVKPAPMAPRIIAAPKPKIAAPQIVAVNTELAERIRQQREAAERMAEQRIAEAKERAVQPSPPPFSAPVQESRSARPRFSFAEEELKPARQEPATKAQTAPGRWNQVPPQRPMFTAERFASGPAPDSILGASPAGQRPAIRAGAVPYPPPPPAAPAMPQRGPPPPRPMPSTSESSWQGQGPTRPRGSPPPPAFDPYRREPAQTRGYGQNDQYVEENLYRGERGRANAYREPGREPGDYRGAHARELTNVEDQGDDVFEDEHQGAPPRRADARDYNQAYREYEVTNPEESRRRLGPFLLLLALLGVAAIAGGTIYFYQKDATGASLAKGEESVPVVASDGQPVKAQPEAAAETEEPAPNRGSGEQQTSSAPSGQTSAQRKQIYDRILGETTLEEQEQLAPSEEQPLRPRAEEPDSGPSLESQSDGATGQAFDAEPLPLPLPPPPGSSPEDETGGLDLTDQPQQRAGAPEVSIAGAPEPTDTASATPASTEPDIQPSPTSARQAVPSQKPASAQGAAAKGSEEILSNNDPQQDLIVSGGSDNAAGQTPEPEPVLSGTGPVLIAPQGGVTAPPVSPDLASLPQPVPNATTIRKSKVGSRGSKSADTGGVSVAASNFNRQASQQQVASLEPGLVDQQVAPEPAPQVPEQQAALPPPTQTLATQPPPTRPAQSEPSTAPAAPGFVMLFSSHRSEAEALAEFERLRTSHAGLVGSLSPSVRKTNLGSSGTRYQLSLGVVPTRDAAKSLCSSLFAAGEKDCIVRPR